MKIVLIGASNDEEKFGNKILKDLISKGHTVIPVNPNEKDIEGIKCNSSLETVFEDYDIINFVVPSNVTIQILKKYCSKIKDKKIWCQPGSSDNDVKEFLKSNGFKDFITDSCIMIEDIS